MRLEIFLLLAILLLLFAYIVFRYFVRRDYRDRGQLGAVTSITQLSVFVVYFGFPYLFNPPEWAWFWRQSGSAPQALQLLGFGLICGGIITAFGTMAWFGMGKAFGVIIEGITIQGPYKISRNPQILGIYLMVIGTVLQRPSLYAVVWLVMYSLISHWNIMTEEDHLYRIFREKYQKYCSEVPRYLRVPKKTKEASA
ncbi:MAG: hypothetical protein JRI92_04015 [Deltaproteobacteria bacterium]|nr:hypothetical protein [Deltaproteobacteria bacterium]